METKINSGRIRLPLMNFGTLIIVVILGFVSRKLIEQPMTALDYAYLIVGAVSVWLFFMNFSDATVFNRRVKHVPDNTKIESVISCIAMFALFGLVCLGMVVMLLPSNFTGAPQTNPDAINGMLLTFFLIDAILLIFIAIAMNIWSKCIVADGYLVLIDTKVLYPGQKYRIWPWMSYNDQVVKAEFPVKTQPIETQCKNDVINIQAASSMKVDIEEAKKRGITNINLSALLEEAENSLDRLIQNQARSITVSELFKGALNPEKLIVAGVPVVWEGRVQVSSVPA